MLEKMEQKGFKTAEDLFLAVKEVRWRTKYAWVIVPNKVTFEGQTTVYATPCESVNIIKEICTTAERIAFDIKECPEEIHYFWVE